MIFQFTNAVVVEEENIGVIVKSWQDGTHDVYIRYTDSIKNFHEKDIKHYVYSKELLDEQKEFY